MSCLLTLYHGSYLAIEKPDISFSHDNVDFGKGFYTTPIREQAQNWARRFVRSHGKDVLSLYEIDAAALRAGAAILEFQSYSDEWLEFIDRCRKGECIGDYDVVIGGVADDKIFNTIQLYSDGLLDKREAIKRLQYEKPNCQYCFRSQTVIETYLKFINSEKLS
jgi:hypothetical protein